MEILIKVIQFLLSISILVILHEAGHFVFARIFKTRVEKFYLFFNPWFSLFKARRGDQSMGLAGTAGRIC
jgi:regulator of sigma E protease